MNDKQQLQEMGLHLSEQQAKGLADAFAESDFAGELVPMQEGGLCMAKQIEDLQARLQECANGAAKMQEQRDYAYKMMGKLRLLIAACNRIEAEAEEFNGPDGMEMGIAFDYWHEFAERLDDARSMLAASPNPEPTK